MTPQEYQLRRERIVQLASRLMRGSQAAKDAYIASEVAKLDSEAGKTAALPQPKTAPKSALQLKLERVGDKWIGPCRACREHAGDRQGRHLVVFASGAFGCVQYQEEEGREHRRRMVELTPELRGKKGRGYIPLPGPDTTKEEAEAKAKAAALWAVIVEELAGEISDLGPSGPIPVDHRDQFLLWCRAWQLGELGWVGWRNSSPKTFAKSLFQFADPIQAIAAWEMIVQRRYDHTSGAIWTGPELGRKKENVAGHRLLVLEHDGPKERRTPLREQVAFLRYVIATYGDQITLQAVVSTAGKGFHAHFDAQGLSTNALQELRAELISLGADSAVLSNSSTRIPGAIRQPDPDNPEKPHGGRQSLLWINPNLTILNQ